ncbi:MULTISPECIES: hypothetical protein [Pseudomonas]|jgi:lysozyme family protein|uniref:hypothetical protein n=1 Tax=Pseudomonas TaxID=286 RepID=UPI000518DDB5|nr:MULTISPECIES: hypothetical protein [Pseudomonas]MDR7284281.1 lysozyme family protein [Pseudomonas corrugata]
MGLILFLAWRSPVATVSLDGSDANKMGAVRNLSDLTGQRGIFRSNGFIGFGFNAVGVNCEQKNGRVVFSDNPAAV